MTCSRTSSRVRPARLLPGITRTISCRRAPGFARKRFTSNGSLADDFLFAETDRVLHVQNAPSPAATSSLAIARVIADRTLAKLGRPSPTAA